MSRTPRRIAALIFALFLSGLAATARPESAAHFVV